MAHLFNPSVPLGISTNKHKHVTVTSSSPEQIQTNTPLGCGKPFWLFNCNNELAYLVSAIKTFVTAKLIFYFPLFCWMKFMF